MAVGGRHLRIQQTPRQGERWPGLLVGSPMICAYLGGLHPKTLTAWRRKYRLPIGHSPTGTLIASTAMLDAWICYAIETELSELQDKTGWRNVEYGLYSGIRIAYESRYVASLAETAGPKR